MSKNVKKYNPEVDFSDLRWSQKLVIPVIKEMTPKAANIVYSSPTVPSKSFENDTAIDKFQANSYYPLLFIALIITFIIHMKPHASSLRQKFKTVFAFIR